MADLDDGRFDDAEDDFSDELSDALPSDDEDPEFDEVFDTALEEGWVTEAEYDALTDEIASGGAHDCSLGANR
eukprot:3528668-Prymnesium_polylepis.1